MQSVGTAVLFIIRLKAARAVRSWRIGTRGGGGGRNEGRIVRGQFARVQICGRGLPIRLCKGGDLVIKEREANTRRGMQVSRCKSRSRRQRRYPYTIMQPNNQWWLSCACALHFLAPKYFIRMSQSSSTIIFSSN